MDDNDELCKPCARSVFKTAWMNFSNRTANTSLMNRSLALARRSNGGKAYVATFEMTALVPIEKTCGDGVTSCLLCGITIEA